MKAITYTQYGSPDVLQLQEVEKPTPKANQVLVKIHAAATNAADWHIMRGSPFFARFSFGLLKPKHPRLGLDFAGTVEAVGSDVTEFQPGDAVFGTGPQGTFAEYVCAPAEVVVHKPDNISFEAAASVGVAGLTALQGLRDAGQLQAGQQVLINGASGGVGTFAVQVAKALGAEVTGVCSTGKVEQTRSIGADHVIDYKREDFTRSGQQYDIIYDVGANRTMADYARALKPGGRYVMAGFSTMGHMLFQVVIIGSLRSRFGDKHLGMMGTAQPNKADLLTLKDMLASGQINPVVERAYPLSETADAIRYLEDGHAYGKIVVNVL